jgi:hypothetical protein
MSIGFNPFTGTFDFKGSSGTTANSFETIQPDTGTSPVADSATDILTLIGDGTITTNGNSVTDTITIQLGTVPISKGGTGQVTANAGLNALLPNQAGNVGKFLKTDGSNASWAAVSSLDLVSYTQFGGF